MITEEQAENIKSIIGANYSKKIEHYLAKKAIRNTIGLPYSAHYIRNVVNGTTYCEALELNIVDAVAYYKRKNAREEKRRKLIIQSA